MATHRFVIEGTEYEVHVGARSGNSVAVTVNGKSYLVELHEDGAAAPPVPVAAAAPAARTAPVSRPAAAAGGEIRAPISGIVLNVMVQEGQKIGSGQVLLILEAMKMENEIFAPFDGIIASVAAKPQQEVRQGDLLITISPS